jgi:hypothetical protein
MTVIAIDQFGGMSPRTDPAMLTGNAAQLAQDVRLHSGAIKGWRKPLSLIPMTPVDPLTQTIYYDQGEGVWYNWLTDVNIVLGPVADTTGNYRYYFTGDGGPKKTDSTLGVTGTGTYPRTTLNLGVPAPTLAPTLALAGVGSGDNEDRVYVYTNISEFSGVEEESAPSPPATITIQPGNSVNLSALSAFPTGDYQFTKRRIYRLSSTEYLYVGETATTTFPDTVANDDLAEPLGTTHYDEPPAGLTGLTSMANGNLAAFLGNELYFCEPYKPHAWPASYRLTTNEPIVALVAVSQGMYVLTTGHPYFCSGLTPDSMTMERLTKYAPCVSKRSAVTDGIGVLYATYNGIAYIQGAGVDSLTKALFTQEEWGTYAPDAMHGIWYDERYTMWYLIIENVPFIMNGAYAMDGTQEMNGVAGLESDMGAGLVLDTSVPSSPLTEMSTFTTATHIRADTGKLYIVSGGEVMQFDGDEYNRTPYEWRSKLFVLPHPTNFSSLQVIADNSGGAATAAAKAIADANAIINANLWAAGAYQSGWADCGINQYDWNGTEMINSSAIDSLTLSVKVYADGILRHAANVTNNLPMRLPSGFQSDTWEIAVSGNKTVRRIAMANSIAELTQV